MVELRLIAPINNGKFSFKLHINGSKQMADLYTKQIRL